MKTYIVFIIGCFFGMCSLMCIVAIKQEHTDNTTYNPIIDYPEEFSCVLSNDSLIPDTVLVYGDIYQSKLTIRFK